MFLANSLEKTLMLRKIEGKGRRKRQRHRLKGHELELTLEDRGGQESLTCCSACSCKDSDFVTDNIDNVTNIDNNNNIFRLIY